MSSHEDDLGVAEAKARFSELIDRVTRGEKITITRRGRPVIALVRPDQALSSVGQPLGLAAGAGALADWEDLAEVMADVQAARRSAKDRPPPDLG